MKLHGARNAAKHLASGLIERGIDMAYAYKTLHMDGLAHAFTNTLLYLDWDRRGFPWPVIPFAINCYGRNLIHAKGGMAALFLPPTNGYLWPDHAADRLMFDALSHADYEFWRKRPLQQMEQAGQHEMLNWMALMGAMETLDRKPVVHDYVETHVFMSEKCFVSYPA